MTRLMIFLIASFALVGATPLQILEIIPSSNEWINYEIVAEHEEMSEEFCSANSTEGAFTIYDYAIVIGMLVISLGIGVFYGFFDKKSGESSNFLQGSDMSVSTVTLSLTTSFITAIELLGNPAEVFFNGSQFALIVISMLLVIPLAVKVFYPIYDSMKLTSCYEYLGMRFGKEMRIFGGSLYVLQMCFYTSVSVLAPAIALSKATGLNTRLAVVLIYVVCIFYSSQGGLKAVVIADTFQACVLFVSLILILVIGTYLQEGGIAEIFKIAKENDRLELLNFDFNPTTRHTVFSVIIGGFFYWASLLCVNQSSVQKAMSLKSLSKARVAITLSVFGLAAVFLMNFYTGLMTFAKYETCDPLKAGKIDAIDQLVPFYVMQNFGSFTTFVGIFVAGIFAASLGTVAACLSSLSAVTIEDLLISGLNIKISPEKSTQYAKWMNFLYGVASFGLIFLIEGRSVLQATLTLNGLIGGIVLGLFSLGIFFKRANLKGALYGGILSTFIVITLGIFALTFNEDEPFLSTSIEGCSCKVNETISIPLASTQSEGPWYTSIYKVSYMWYSMIGTILTVVLGLTISIITQSYDEWKINRITDSQPERFSSNSFRESTRKISMIVHNLGQDMKQSTTKIENKICDVISHSSMHNGNEIDRMRIINEETIQVGENRENVSVISVFNEKTVGIDNLGMTKAQNETN